MKKSKAEAAAEPRKKRLMRSIKHTFTQEERIGLGDTMANKMNEIDAKESEAKRAAQQFKTEITGLQAELDSARNGFQAGFEMRAMEVLEVMDRPKPGEKEICVEDDEYPLGRRVLFVEKMNHIDLNPPLPGIPDPIEPGQPLNSVAAAVEKAGEAAEGEDE